MKTSMKLVVVAVALFVFATFAAACGPLGTTPTTEAPVTTTETPVTTTGSSVQKEDLADDIKFGDKTTNFTGRPINQNAYKVSGMNTAVLDVVYSFKDAAGNVSATAPTNVGVYEVTATFSFDKAEYAEEYLLPAPMTVTLEVLPVDAPEFGFEGVDADNNLFGYYYDGCDYSVEVGALPYGLEVTYTMMKCDPTTGRPIMPPVIVPNDVNTGIPSATEAGVYLVMAEFEDKYGNYNPDSYPDMTATLTVKENPNQVLMFTPIIDGQLDEEYLQSAFFTSTLDETADPESNCIFTSVTASTATFGASATVYYLWDGDYVYVCMVVEDRTFYARSDGYVAQPDPWRNDAAEIYYFFGGHEQPVVSSNNIYPTYAAFTTDSKGRGDQNTGLAASTIPAGKDLIFTNAKKISAVPAQRSAYFNEILCSTTLTTAEPGQPYSYTIEMAIPAKSETLANGQNGQPQPDGSVVFKNPGKAITAGEFGFVCIQVNDLSYLPAELPKVPECDKYIDVIKKEMSQEWKDYEELVNAQVMAYSNREKPEHFNCIQFSDVAVGQ